MLLKKKIVLRYVLAFLLVMQTVNLGALQGVAASGIPVSIQNSEKTESLVIESATAVLDINDEAIVTVTVKNNSTTDHVAGFVATGFDVNGKTIETNTYFLDNGWGTPKKIPATSTQELTLRLKTGSAIANVTVSPLGMHNGVNILSSAYRIEDGNIIASAVVENASEVEQMVGILAEAKDSNGLNYMVKTITPERFGPAPIKPLTAVRLELVFEGAAADIHSMGFSLTGESTEVELLSSGVQKVNGQLVVTGVAENGSSVNSTVGFTVTGYDENDLPIETATDFSKDSFGAIQVKPHVPVGLKTVLTAGDKIKRVETKVTGVSQGIELLSYGVNNVGDQYHITGVVENGTDVASELEIIARSYNYSGELIEQRRVKTNGFFEKERIIPPHAPALLSLTLNDANVEKILVDTPDKIDSTQNVLYIVDQKAPYVKTSFSTQNANVQGNLSITFNENIFSDTGFEDILLVSDSGEESLIASAINGNKLEVTLREVLDLGKSYTLKIPANTLKDYVGNSLGTNHEYPFQTKPEAGNVEDFLIVKGTETWSANETFAKSVIVPPNTVLTIPDGAIFLKDLIVYGSLQNEGSFNVNGTWFNGMGYQVPPVSIISQVINADGNYTVKGKTVPGFTLNAGENKTIADGEGNFELTGTSADGVVLIEVEDNFYNSYPAKKLQYDPLIGDQNLKVEEAVNAINAIPPIDLLTLKDETLVTTAREKVNAALNAGAVEAQIPNLSVLIKAETKLEELKSIKENSITAAVHSIDALPTLETLTLADESNILAARGFVKKAINAGATEIEITNLAKLTGLEEKLEILKAAKQAAVEEAIAAIEALPTVETVILANEPDVKAARELVNKALAAGALESEITNLDKLIALEEKLVYLKGKAAIIDEAIAVIENLPTEETLKLEDTKKVEEARSIVNKALDAGIVETDITNLSKLVSLEAKITELLHVKKEAVENAITAIQALPTLDALKITDEGIVLAARELVKKALEAGALESEITNLDQLIDLEGKLASFIAEKLEAVNFAIDAIAKLSEDDAWLLAHEPSLIGARGSVEYALKLGALESEITNLNKLVALEERYATLYAAKQATKDEAIAAIDQLPSLETLMLSDEKKVTDARALVKIAFEAGILDWEITNLNTLVALEERLIELKAIKTTAVDSAIKAISHLVDEEEIALVNAPMVEDARKLVRLAIEAGASESEITNLDKLVSLENRIKVLVEIAKAITAADDFIAALPERSEIKISDEAAIVKARELINYAISLGADTQSFKGLAKLDDLEWVLNDLKANFDVTAPESPIVYEVTDYDLHVKGKAEPGSIISVKISGSEIGSGIVQTDGTFSVEIPAYFTPGSTITVTATDAAGNVSNPTTVITVKVSNGWRYTLGTWFYIQSGEKAKGWNYIGNKWYHFSQWGAMDTGWLKENDKWYYLTNNGDMVTGWLKSNSKWYYLDGSGAMKTGWVQSGGKWYYLDGSGAMKTGWLQSGGKWYYMASNGVMNTGWIQTGGKWYYLYSSGAMAYNTTIDSYKLGKDGAWIK